MRGPAAPLTSWEADLEELAMMASSIENWTHEMSAFCSFTDQDGEVLYVRSEQVMLMDSIDYSEVIEAEIAAYKAELKETEGKGRRTSKRAPKPAPSA